MTSFQLFLSNNLKVILVRRKFFVEMTFSHFCVLETTKGGAFADKSYLYVYGALNAVYHEFDGTVLILTCHPKARFDLQ